MIVARGSSDYAAIFGRYLIEAASGRPVALAAPCSADALRRRAAASSGWLARRRVASPGADAGDRDGARALRARRRAHDRHDERPDSAARAVGRRGTSTSARATSGAVPATKTFTAQLAAFALIAEALGPVPGRAPTGRRCRVRRRRARATPRRPSAAAARLWRRGRAVCLGRGYLLCVAFEAALKLREAAGVRAEGWSAADFRHGPVTVARGDLPRAGGQRGGPGRRRRRGAGDASSRPRARA